MTDAAEIGASLQRSYHALQEIRQSCEVIGVDADNARHGRADPDLSPRVI